MAEISSTPDSGGATADRPLTKLEDDELGYRDFAQAIAAALTSRAGDEGIVIAVHGRWGTGKTSAVNMAINALERIERSIDEDTRTIVVRFNPWWFSEQKDLTRAFFSEFNAAIGRRLSQGVRDGLRKVAKRVSGATDFVSAVLEWTPAGPAAKQLAELLKGAGEELDEERSLDEVREDLSSALRDQTRKIVVVIDDVDRLVADEVRQIFRLVKSVADLPRVTYLLVFDRDIAERALEAPSGPDSPAWLEKIVQASFDLPPVAQTDLNRLFLNRLVATIGSEKVTNPVRWGNTFHGAIAPWLRTARDVGRLANAVAMTWPSVKGEVDVGDFVAIQTLRLFEPTLFEFVRAHPEQLTGAEPDQGRREDREAFGEELLATVPEVGRKRAKRALCYIFPRLDAIFANTWRGGDWRRDERDRLVSSRRRFPVYFSLGLGDGIISSAEFDAVRATFGDPAKTRDIIRKYAETPRRAGGSRASVLLDALMAQAEDVPVEDAEQTARALLASADLFFNTLDGARTPDGLPMAWAVSFAIDPVLAKLDAASLALVLADAADGPSPVFANFEITTLSAEHGRVEGTESKPEDERRLTIEAVVELEGRMSSRVERDADSGALLSIDDAASMIWCWVGRSGKERVRNWIAGRLDQPKFARWIMKTFTGDGTSQSFDDMVGQRFYTVNAASLREIADVDLLRGIAQTMIDDGSDPDDVAAHFIQGLDYRI